jgi:hypothetical protein
MLFSFTLIPVTVFVTEKPDYYVRTYKVSAKFVVQYHYIEVPALEEHTCTIAIKGNKIILHSAYENNGIIINQLTVN